ncbi:MAG: galactokinase [Rubrobacteraceae bacterium]
MRETEQRAVEAYKENFGAEPETVVSAPGRVNLIGEHTDYNDGHVLPCAVERRVAVAIGHGDNELYSADFDEKKPVNEEKEGGWQDYPRGVAWAVKQAGYEVGGEFRVTFAGNVPLGSGLSSSAAIEAATVLALDALFELGMDRKQMASLCMKAENEFVGVQSGIMDQYASLLCDVGHALLVDCRSLEEENIPLDLEGAGLALLVCDTRVERELGDTGFNERQETTARAARTLGLEALRDASESDLEKLSGDELKRARHVVTEQARVMEAVEALKNEDFETFGRLLYVSHASLRDDYEVSVPELDTFVEVAEEAGALGARVTGAGWGGCAIALVPTDKADELADTTRQRFEERDFGEPAFYKFVPAAGAEVLS